MNLDSLVGKEICVGKSIVSNGVPINLSHSIVDVKGKVLSITGRIVNGWTGRMAFSVDIDHILEMNKDLSRELKLEELGLYD